MKKVYRLDFGNVIDYMYEDADGFLRGDGLVTRTGVFTYVNQDGSLRKELRHPSDVLRLDSISTMKMIPLTNNHPTEFVTPENAKQLTVGHVGENIRPDGEMIVAPVIITDKVAIDSARNGKQQLSLGYEVDLIEESGEYDGIRYDFRQTNIRYNHLALVESGRAGNNAKLKFDGLNEIAVQKIDDDNNKQKPKSQKRRDNMNKFRIDGIDYDAAPEVTNFISKLQAKNDGLVDENKKFKADVTTVTADRDDKAAKLIEAEKKHNNKDEIARLVKERVDLMTTAITIINDSKINLDEMSHIDVKKEVIKKVFPDTKFDGDKWEDEVYVNARYDGVVDNFDADKLASQKKKTFDPSKKTNTDNVDENDPDAVRAKVKKDAMSAYQLKEK